MYKVYWTGPQNEACGEEFSEMNSALAHTKYLRDIGRTFVTMVSENPNVVGKAGVDAVVDGKLPNGETYEWKKRRV